MFNLILGAELVDGASSYAVVIGGLVARGLEAVGSANEGPRLNPRFDWDGVAGGLVAGEAAEGIAGAVPELNSSQRGHFRFVSEKNYSVRRGLGRR